jgi:hypothetical protein
MSAELIAPITAFAMIFGIVYIALRHKERMTLIRTGGNAANLNSKTDALGSLKWGMIFVGIGIGIIVGKIVAAYTGIEAEAAFFSMICLFGGLALMIFYIIARKK